MKENLSSLQNSIHRLPKAVILDWDNTLISSWECIHAALQDTLKAMDHKPWTFEETCNVVRRSLHDRFPLLFKERWEQAKQIYYERYQHHAVDNIKPLQGAHRLLTLLNQKLIYVCIVSNKQGNILRDEVALLGWEELFGKCVGASDATHDKPSLAPVSLALQPISMYPGLFHQTDVWFVGDTEIDMECAHAAGCLPILVGSYNNETIHNYSPAIQVQTCDDLANLLQSLDKITDNTEYTR